MWTDDYISGELLSVHLNENLDLASRKKTTVTSTVNWILDKAKGENLEILDLGCGPGLYAEILANRGHNVTGVDFSKRSIEYAKNEAVRKKLKIEYINQNYLELNFENKFDLVILVYTDFGVLLPEDRDQLLNKIKRALKPGGIFIFDVLNDKELDKKVSPPNWELTEKGFWRDNPYLALSGSFLYKENKVILYQHIIIDESGDYGNYRFWTHFFSDDDLQEVLKGFDFKDISFDKTVLPPNDIWSGDNVTFCVVKK
jgi:SAM-dependent methyltransferase